MRMAERPAAAAGQMTNLKMRFPTPLRVGLTETPTGTIGGMPMTKGPGIETVHSGNTTTSNMLVVEPISPSSTTHSALNVQPLASLGSPTTSAGSSSTVMVAPVGTLPPSVKHKHHGDLNPFRQRPLRYLAYGSLILTPSFLPHALPTKWMRAAQPIGRALTVASAAGSIVTEGVITHRLKSQPASMGPSTPVVSGQKPNLWPATVMQTVREGLFQVLATLTLPALAVGVARPLGRHVGRLIDSGLQVNTPHGKEGALVHLAKGGLQQLSEQPLIPHRPVTQLMRRLERVRLMQSHTYEWTLGTVAALGALVVGTRCVDALTDKALQLGFNSWVNPLLPATGKLPTNKQLHRKYDDD